MIYTLAEVKELKCFHVYKKYISHGYRREQTVQQCYKTFFKLHNETMNVWTHLLPALYFTYHFYQIIL